MSGRYGEFMHMLTLSSWVSHIQKERTMSKSSRSITIAFTVDPECHDPDHLSGLDPDAFEAIERVIEEYGTDVMIVAHEETDEEE